MAGIDATSIERPQSKTLPDRTVVYKPNLEDEQQAHQLWLAVLDGRTPARAAQQLDGRTRRASHPLGPNERGGGSSPTASACSAASMSSDRGQRSPQFERWSQVVSSPLCTITWCWRVHRCRPLCLPGRPASVKLRHNKCAGRWPNLWRSWGRLLIAQT